VKIPAAEIKNTPFANVHHVFVNVTPELAADWLKQNRRNRKLKERVLEKYIMDMTNGAWLTTHECVAFDNAGILIDGQHRLEGILRAKVPVLMVVSVGWPELQGKKKTMDAVNVGATRSLADQLHLQHDIPTKQAATVVQICNALAAASFDLSRVRASTTDTILAVFALYKNEINWWLANPITQHGIKQATVAACLIMGRATWADKCEDARTRLETGENLTRENPLLHLRNWLMGVGGREDNAVIRQVVFHHLASFVDDKSCPQIIVNSNAAVIRVLKLHKVRVEKICAIYNQPLPKCLRAGADAAPAVSKKSAAFDAEALRLAATLQPVFTSTDLVARVDDNAVTWLLQWRNAGWIESAGVNQFKKTEKFGSIKK
jgi:hypothetical protein